MSNKKEEPEFDYVAIAYENLMPLKGAADAEGVKRAQVEASPEFIALNKKIAFAQLEQADMLDGLEEKQKIYDEARKVFSKVLLDSGKTSYKEWRAKIKKLKRVDNHRLMRVLDGDIDAFMAIANVTQVALKAHADGHADRDALLDTIEEYEQIVDVEFDPMALH